MPENPAMQNEEFRKNCAGKIRLAQAAVCGRCGEQMIFYGPPDRGPLTTAYVANKLKTEVGWRQHRGVWYCTACVGAGLVIPKPAILRLEDFPGGLGHRKN